MSVRMCCRFAKQKRRVNLLKGKIDNINNKLSILLYVSIYTAGKLYCQRFNTFDSFDAKTYTQHKIKRKTFSLS